MADTSAQASTSTASDHTTLLDTSGRKMFIFAGAKGEKPEVMYETTGFTGADGKPAAQYSRLNVGAVKTNPNGTAQSLTLEDGSTVTLPDAGKPASINGKEVKEVKDNLRPDQSAAFKNSGALPQGYNAPGAPAIASNPMDGNQMAMMFALISKMLGIDLGAMFKGMGVNMGGEAAGPERTTSTWERTRQPNELGGKSDLGSNIRLGERDALKNNAFNPALEADKTAVRNPGPDQAQLSPAVTTAPDVRMARTAPAPSPMGG
jgi:hypothetical protein